MKRVIGIVVVGLLVGLLAALNGSSTASARPQVAAFTPTLAAWVDRDGLEHSRLTVPLDYANPDNGKTVQLEISRLRADPSAGAYAGILVLNPGGPGGSGTWTPFLRDYVPGTSANRYDWVGFDPRGVGASTPSLHCNAKYFGPNRPSFVPRTSALMKYWVKRTAGYATACGRSSAKALLPFMNTRDTVRDMESLRVALQDDTEEDKSKLDKLNYYGFSYGTYLGVGYATLYPAKVGRFILDGVVDPARFWYRSNLDQDVAFDKNLNRFFAWVARHNRTYRLGAKASTIRSAYYALLRKLDRRPSAGGRLGPDELGDAMLGVAYGVGNWAGVARDYARLVRQGRGYPMYARYASSSMGAANENGYAVYLGVECTDQGSPSLSVQVSDARRIHRTRPFMTWNNTWYNMPCRTWPAPARGKITISGAGLQALGTKILLINETYDAATPYSGALNVRALFPTASLIAGVGGTTHSASLSGIACVDNRIANFLNPANGAVPTRLSGRRADVNCPAVPKPSAGRTTARTAAGMPADLRARFSAAQSPFFR